MLARVNARTVIGAAVVVAVVVSAAIVWWAARSSAETPSCRLLDRPETLRPLSDGVVRDLDSDESRLDLADLRTPTQDQAAEAGSVRASRGVTWVCGWREPGQVAVIARSKEEDTGERCYGPPEACADIGMPRVWVTCYQGLDLASGRKTLQGGCIGFMTRSHD